MKLKFTNPQTEISHQDLKSRDNKISHTKKELKFSNSQAEQFYIMLRDFYKKAALNKRELANEIGVSLSTIDLYISKGVGIPNYKKLGTAKNAKVVFNIIDVAEFLSQTIKTA